MPRLPRLSTCLLLLALAACDRDGPSPAPGGDPGGTAGPDRAASPRDPVELQDVMETGDGYIIGISYPRSVEKYPGLAAAMQAYADESRAQLMQALRTPEADGGDPTVPGPYDLSLAFVELHSSPEVVAVAADGSSYLGGAHGQPLVRRFVWLPAHDRMLTARELVPTEAGWHAISRYVRDRLFDDLSARREADGADPAEREDAMRGEAAMIEQGTAPDPANFDQFEPIPGDGGGLAGLRFVFPPYQVGPYAAGTRMVDVPAEVLLPHVAPRYRGLFAAGPVAAGE